MKRLDKGRARHLVAIGENSSVAPTGGIWNIQYTEWFSRGSTWDALGAYDCHD